MKRIGIECEQLEGERFGVGRTLAQLLEELTRIPTIEKRFRFVLYFKSQIPEDAFLAHPIFEKKVLTGGVIPRSFNVFYHILLPIRYCIDTLDLFFFPSYMLPAFFIGKSIVVLTNDAYWEAHYGTLPFRYRISYRMFCYWATKRASKIMSISQFSADELMKLYNIPYSRMFVNPWGLDPVYQQFKRADDYEQHITALKNKYNIQGDYFISVGQAFPRRGVREAMQAFGIIAKKYPDMQYVVACNDKYTPPQLADIAHNINSEVGREAVIYTKSYIDHKDLPYLFSETKALIYISSKEALGLPPLEALTCDSPAIIADTPLAHELLGDVGFFVKDLQDTNEIAKNMEIIINDSQEVKQIIALQKPHLHYCNWHTHALQMIKTIEEITTTS